MKNKISFRQFTLTRQRDINPYDSLLVVKVPEKTENPTQLLMGSYYHPEVHTRAFGHDIIYYIDIILHRYRVPGVRNHFLHHVAVHSGLQRKSACIRYSRRAIHLFTARFDFFASKRVFSLTLYGFAPCLRFWCEPKMNV